MEVKNESIDISVCIPIYGVEKYVERSLRSLFEQTKTDGVEFIIVNDCTKDNSMVIARRVIEEYPNLDIKIIEHETNCGLAVTRQTGFDAASGDYILCCDSDDWCEPEMLEEMYEAALTSDADVVMCDFFYTSPTKEDYVRQQVADSGEACVEDLLYGRLLAYLWCKLFKRELFTKNDIRWKAGLNMWEDMLICSRVLCYATKVAYLPKAYTHYLQIVGSVSDVKGDTIKTNNVLSVVSEIETFYKERSLFDKFFKALIYIKIRIKLDVLCQARGRVQRSYMKIFPEIHDHIDSFTSVPWHFRRALKDSSRGSLWLFNLIIAIKSLRRRIFRRRMSRF